MTGMLSWLEGFRTAEGPRYLRIVAALEAAVASGALLPGERLPPQRVLAEHLGLDLTTVTRAYQECGKRGLTDPRGPQGTFVAPPKVEFSQVIDLSMNIPPAPLGVNLMELLSRGMSQVLARTSAPLLMTYQLGGGSAADQEAGRRWLKPMLGASAQRPLLVCPGAQTTLAALVMTLTRPGDRIGCEPLAYPGVLLACQSLGRAIAVIETDEEGMTPSGLRRAHQQTGLQVIYLNPTAQNPTAHTMPAARRKALAAVAIQLGIIVIEDDPYWLLAEDPPPPFATYAPAQTCYLATLSKCLSPGLRTAYLVLADRVDAAAFLTSLRSISLMPAPLLISMVTQWILDGTAQELLRGVQEEAQARRAIARNALTGLRPDRCDGVHLWHVLPQAWEADTFVRAARDEGVTVAPSTAFAASAPVSCQAIRVSLGAVATRNDLTNALRKLDRILQQGPFDLRQIVV